MTIFMKKKRNPYRSLLPTVAEGNRNDRGIAVLTELVGIVKELTDVFPPLKAAVAGLLEVLKRIDVRSYGLCLCITYSCFQAVKGAKEEIEGAIKTFEQLIKILKAHAYEFAKLGQHKSWLLNRIDLVSESVLHEFVFVDYHYQSGRLQGYRGADQQVEASARPSAGNAHSRSARRCQDCRRFSSSYTKHSELICSKSM